jgi:hypothetical protein
MDTICVFCAGHIIFCYKLKRRKKMSTLILKFRDWFSGLSKPEIENPEIERAKTQTEILKEEAEQIKLSEQKAKLEAKKVKAEKTASIAIKKAKSKTIAEHWLGFKTKIGKKYKTHDKIYIIALLLNIASLVLHGLSILALAKIWFPTVDSGVLFAVSFVIALALDSTAVSMIDQYEDKFAWITFGIVIGFVVYAGYYEHTQGLKNSVSLGRTIVGVVAFIALVLLHYKMRKNTERKYRIDLDNKPKPQRQILLESLAETKTLIDSKIEEFKKTNPLGNFKTQNDYNNALHGFLNIYKLNFQDIVRVYGIKTPSLEKETVKLKCNSVYYFKQFPKKKASKKKAKKSGKPLAP